MSGPVSAPLVILPGLMCDGRMFGAQLDRFPGTIVIEGFYGGARSLGAMADYALERMGPRGSLMGHSMGGRVALELLRRAPDRVERIALADTGTHPVQPGEAEKRHALGAIGRERGMEALVDTWLPPMLSPAAQADDSLVAALKAMCLDAGIETYEAQVEALINRPGADDLLGSITCPALAITGELDAWSPPVQHAAMAEAIPGAVLEVISGAGHMLPVEDPKAFNAALERWLNRR